MGRGQGVVTLRRGLLGDFQFFGLQAPWEVGGAAAISGLCQG